MLYKNEPASRYKLSALVNMTEGYQVKLTVLLKTLMPNMDPDKAYKEINSLINQKAKFSEDLFEKNNPKGFKILEKYLKEEEKIFNEEMELVDKRAIE